MLRLGEIYEGSESRRELAVTGVVEEAGVVRTSVLDHPDRSSLGNEACDLFFEDIGKASAIEPQRASNFDLDAALGWNS
jgi:hypothetical protein